MISRILHIDDELHPCRLPRMWVCVCVFVCVCVPEVRFMWPGGSCTEENNGNNNKN